MGDGSEVVVNIMIDTRLESYRTFFDHKWSAEIITATEGTVLAKIVFSLCASWRGVANTHVWPWLMMSMMKGFADGISKKSDPTGPKWIRAMRERLVNELHGKLSHMKRKQLHDAICKIDDQARQLIDDNPYVFDQAETWQEMITSRAKHELYVGIFESQRLCYGALYHAYENFLTRCLKLQSNGEHKRLPHGRKASKLIAEVFGEEARDFCWSHPEISAARKVRHAIAHNGGEVTEELLATKHNIRVVGTSLYIMAPHTIELHRMLKKRVAFLVDSILRSRGQSTAPATASPEPKVEPEPPPVPQTTQ